MSRFQDNLKIIASTNPGLAQHLHRSEGGVLNVSQARNGMPTARVGDRWVHSAYDPQKEAQTWAEQTIQEHQSGEALLVVGVGLLYHIEILCQRVSSETPILVFVPDVRELVDALSVRDLSRWGERLEWLVGPSEEMAAQVTRSYQRVRLVTYSPAATHYEGEISQFQSAMRNRLVHQQGGRLHIAVIGPIYGALCRLLDTLCGPLNRLDTESVGLTIVCIMLGTKA